MASRRFKMSKKKWLPVFAFLCVLGGSFFLPAQGREENKEILAVQNAIAREKLSWQAGETTLSRLGAPERRRRLGGRLARVVPRIVAPLRAPASLPAALDWRDRSGNWITSIKDQGDCGGCWAFAATAVLESLVKIGTNMSDDIDLSEQTLISCSGAGNCEDGGYDYLAAEYIRTTGIPHENCFPYSATDALCNPCSGWLARVIRIGSWDWVSTSVAGIETALLNGPLSTYMTVYSDFYHYRSGIYQVSSGATEEGGHLVTIIGYDHPGGYWICKNSWGSGWGENGFFRIQMGQADIGIQNLSMSQPIVGDHAPIFPAIAEHSVEEGALLMFTLSASDIDNDPISYRCLNLPEGAVVDASSGVFSWTPTYEQAGAYDLQFAASDGMAETMCIGRVTVTNVKRKPW
jgi:C1A family cysteine protease